jgi:cytochrome c5
MRSPVIAIVLCIVSAAAVAQCVAQPPTATVATATPAALARPGPDPKKPGPELIKTAGAVTHDAPAMRATPSPEKADGEPPRRTGSAMLLAALALMSGIALRRFSARDQ